jgi:RHS repeat-associated protein
MVYDVAGNLRKTITRRGHTIQSYYDSRNRDTLTNIPGIGDRKQVFGGPQDQLTRVFVSNDADSIGGVKRDVSWVFDPHGRLISDTSYTGSTAQGTTYTYDQYERLHTSTDPVGIWRTEYNIKFGGLPRLLVTPFGDSLSYSTDALHRMSGPVVMSSGPNLSFHLAWNDRGRLDSIVQTVSTTPSSFTPLTFFAGTAGDPSLPGVGPSWSEQHGAGATVEGLQDSVTYDGWGRVTAWVAKRAGATVATESYSFDRVGNVRTTGGAEKYDAVTGRLLVRTNGSWTDTLFYDRAGNLDSSKSVNGSARKYRGYDYDALNRLVTVRDSGVRVARYSYDVLGRRIAKRVYSSRSGGDTVYTRFVYHGSNVAFEMDSTNAMRRRYTWGLGTDNLVGVRDSAGGVATQYYAVKDKLGSVRGLIKRDGTWKYSERFAPYGARAEWAGDSSLALRYRWTGREYDAETGFYYFRARYYEPIARRFVQEDPIGFGGGSNLYAYVGGAVLETRDPSGLSPGPGFTGDQEWWDQNRWCDDALCFFHGDDGRSSGPWSDGDSDGFDDLSQLVDAVWRRTWQERHEPQVTTVEVGCRPVRHMYGAAGHCAVRLKDPTGRERVAELVQGSDGKNEIITWNANSASASDYIWVPVEIPSGMTAEGFNTAVWNSFLSVTSEMNGQTYHWDGGRNSNHFVFEIITRAGGQVPNIPWIQLFIPGICGGTGLSKGNSCHSGG